MRKSILVGVCLAALLPAAVQAQNVEGRVGKLESEMRAVQRKVFPGGAGQMLQPEVRAPQSEQGPGPGSPATSALADVNQRVTSLEQQMTSLTEQIEQNQNRTRQLQDAFDNYRRSNDARLKTLETGPAPIATGAGGPIESDDQSSGPSRPTTRPETASKPGAATPIKVSVEKPSTGDPAEDEYMYGYRLWAAKQYPQAEAQLKKVVAEYPKSKRASYAQNLLGRSYLDEGKPSLASMAFYDNYKKMPEGERAPDSLLYLGQALTKLNKPADACKVYDELNDVYGAKMASAMKGQVAAGRSAAKCK
ncbi:TolA-binding protein [Sphingomonas sp. PP-CE-3G-477]|uniref:tetratricopeptide repeat protein n=1 Tax=Sphingomonas sp. PP-CE-3G-477 TaxID=2135660 RepID=UPI000D3521A6|nr:tetratricopeptide repeat protein [Sphingomonas sp. PP-CE-3G-477]PTQ63969.1 TolA-binding protein [Sphingomonas sp. PP-CE-3G-477]